PEQVVLVLRADRYPRPVVIADLVRLEHTVLDSPADIQPVAAIGDRAIPADGRLLRPGARMEAQAGIALGRAALDRHAPGDLEADAVSVVVAHHAVADHDVLALKEVDAATPTAVELAALAAIAFDGQPFD